MFFSAVEPEKYLMKLYSTHSKEGSFLTNKVEYNVFPSLLYGQEHINRSSMNVSLEEETQKTI